MEMIWLIMGRFIKYLRVHTHVIHFLRHSPGHCRLGHCVPFSALQRWETPVGWEISRLPGTLCAPARLPSAFLGAKPDSVEALLRESDHPCLSLLGLFPFRAFLEPLGISSRRPHLTLSLRGMSVWKRCECVRGGLRSDASSRRYSRSGCSRGVVDTPPPTPNPRPQLDVAGELCLGTQGLG